MTPAQKRAYVLADNKLARNAGWDEQILGEELAALSELDLDFDLNVTGFSIPKIDGLIEGLQVEEPGDPEDERLPALADGPPVCRVGDVWRLGPHRLVCGDALDPRTVNLLMDGERARMVFTDPPYNVPIDGHVGGSGAIKHREFAMASGEMSSAEFAAVACISRPAPSPTSSGRAHERRWTLRFERRSPPFIEPLMGWTGGCDTLSQVELSSPSLHAAIEYAEQQGLNYRVESRCEQRRTTSKPPQFDAEDALAAFLTLFWAQSQYGCCDTSGTPDLERAFIEPAAVFRAPDDVVAHPALSTASKREILTRWAWDEYLQQLATDEAMPEGGEPSRLDEVKRALWALEFSDKGVFWLSDRGSAARGGLRRTSTTEKRAS